MQIREHALNVQILMPVFDPKAERRVQKFVSSFSRSITDPDEAIREVQKGLRSSQRKLEDQGIEVELELTVKDKQKIRGHILDREGRREDYKRAKFPEAGPNSIVESAKYIKSKGNNRLDGDEFLSLCRKIAKSKMTDKYIGEALVTELEEATEGLRRNELPEEDAEEIIRAWLSFKKQLEAKGFTVAWFNKRKKSRRGDE